MSKQLEMRMLDTRSGLLSEMMLGDGDLFVSVTDLLGYLDTVAEGCVDTHGLEAVPASQVIASLAQDLSKQLGVTDS